MPDDTTIKRFEKLLSEYLDGKLDENSKQEFVELLNSDPSCSTLLREQLIMDARLTQFESQTNSATRFVDTLVATVAAETDGAAFVDRVVEQSESPTVPCTVRDRTGYSQYLRGHWLALTAIAACLAIGSWWLFTGKNSSRGDDMATTAAISTDDGIAILLNAADIEWNDKHRRFQPGEILAAGPLSISEGALELEFYSGARLVVEAPAELELVSADQVICHRGSIRALVPPAARGFTVLAPQFELVDLGTEFGLSVDPDHSSKVHVFDGEVELYPNDGQRTPEAAEKLLQGDGVVWGQTGKKSLPRDDIESFPSFDKIRKRREAISQRRFEKWTQWNEAIPDDPRLAFHFTIETEGSQLIDRGRTGSHGTIVGAEWTTGRWPSTRALEFKRPGDRVRIDLPGTYDALTLSMWVRMDALPSRSQGLLLTEKYEVGRLHWHIHQSGTMRLGVRKPSEVTKHGATGYGSPVLFTPRKIGLWAFLSTVYDRKAGKVYHYFNGREVSSHEIVYDQPLQIGKGDIGNWIPRKPGARSVRNFVGRIDELTIWKVAMTDEEIHEMYRMTRH